MLRRAYFTLKPFIPLRLRLAMRRINARRIRRECGSYWPICEANARVPEGWPGWPGGKQFAFALSHDVEGQRGLDRCRELAEIEMRAGFRSVFNFIPEGDYTVPESLLSWLVQNGFEVGVHDLKHDGKLFRSREAFEQSATRINEHLARWGAVGFRAGFMLHKLDWLHALNVEYDASTFELDPFEPQPDGTNTIFPFWVPRPDPDADAWRPGSRMEGNGVSSAGENSSGYMELPYTLVQDYNLFVVLGEPGIDVWRQKLQWLASRGGMALVDTHPDYKCLGGRPSAFEFPVQRYIDFLEHVRRDYAGAYWHALPREVARFCRDFRPRHTRPPRDVCMLSYSFYEFDNRVKRYAETLARRGDRVRVLCLGKDQGRRWETTAENVEVLRIQGRKGNERGQLDYLFRLARFWWRALWALRSEGLHRGCDLLHVHNIPDFMVFAGFFNKSRGTRILLDIHDVVPELYQDKFGYGSDALAVRLMRRVEAWSGKFADHVIIANHLWKAKLAQRSVPAGKLTALVNNVDLGLFKLRPRTRNGSKFVLLYPGSLNWHQGLDIAVDAMALLKSSLPEAELHIVGGGPAVADLRAQASKLELQERVRFFDGYPISEIPALMANADAGVVPKRAEGFGNEAYSTKIMEFMSQGLPVVVSGTKIDRHYFTDDEVCFFEPGSASDLAGKILRVANDQEYRQRLSRNALAYAQANSWETRKHVYLDLVDRLTLTGLPKRADSESGLRRSAPATVP